MELATENFIRIDFVMMPKRKHTYVRLAKNFIMPENEPVKNEAS
ncbi:hypothetical protein [Sporomusa acidovorans]|uniref:Uncharacterized protein n=1 Tax=Sporomusa acidovorans (strain ATCC 49682 / DSM 3132 / Mol) TaxID=1123286 RepID=A0ABZ3J5L2_SPOA4|nr:hypothetical protein [Sporomusa acidovorans]OZC24306.1 hypothetical protein SPACI_00730 [Sporomusa acidovorans DSM 3132]SDF02479.1 hypothetical protein SAMN04488499_103012 [Sporomusa acidovorans]